MRLPLKYVFVNQEYGETEFSQSHKEWYRDGKHYGIDFKANEGEIIYAAFGGVVKKYETAGGGISLDIIGTSKKAFHCHLKDTIVDDGTIVKEGQAVALSGRSGSMTTGPHLHFGLAEIKFDGTFVKWLDPSKEFDKLYDGTPIKNKDWEHSRAYHRYGKKANTFAEFCFRFTPIMISNPWVKSGQWVQKRLIKFGYPQLSTDQSNAIIYGAWDFESVVNPAMFFNYAYLTKDEYLCGKKPFQDFSR